MIMQMDDAFLAECREDQRQRYARMQDKGGRK